MDFDGAIQAHTNWKLKIVTAAKNGNSDKLDPAVVGKDNGCALGQWLYGEGKTLMASKAADYSDLVKMHAEFHKEVASLITFINKGQAPQAEAAINDRNSKFSQISLKIVGKLMSLKREIP